MALNIFAAKPLAAGIGVVVISLLCAACATAKALPPEANAEYHIYLCFGQSNMEGYNSIKYPDNGNKPFQAEDAQSVDERFMVLAAVDMPSANRQKEQWYTAYPPLCRDNSGISPLDYFGRTMAANLPKNIKIAVVNVAVAGCDIVLFDKDKYLPYAQNAQSWMQGIIALYSGNPYARLVELAKIAQGRGEIKGILLPRAKRTWGRRTGR